MSSIFVDFVHCTLLGCCMLIYSIQTIIMHYTALRLSTGNQLQVRLHYRADNSDVIRFCSSLLLLAWQCWLLWIPLLSLIGSLITILTPGNLLGNFSRFNMQLIYNFMSGDGDYWLLGRLGMGTIFVPMQPSIASICIKVDDFLFRNVLYNEQHLLRSLMLPPRDNHYSLWSIRWIIISCFL